MQDLTITDVRCLKADSSFLIDDGKTAILYDTGFGFTGAAVAKKVQAALGNRPLDYIFLTHSHYDHVLGCPHVLKLYPDAKVVASHYTQYVFQRDGAKRVMRELDEKYAETCGFPIPPFLGDELRVDIPVGDGDVVQAGDLRFEVLSLPGHTKCCIAFYCRERKFFLSTETLGAYDGEETIVPAFLVSYAHSIASIERAEKLDIRTMISPHYGFLNEQQTAFFLTHMKESSQQFAMDLWKSIQRGDATESIVEAFKEKYRRGYLKEIYPVDAANLNTTIMVELLRKEFSQA